ncbi:twin-arginine translocation signal domain-containing protein [Halorussus ruber]|uniref:twin-arginine translocation signal domain-containing protein n=1 Tax=Halorussus ruber TaxID=1126238 RepID=UPI001091BBD6|nr:twin-arginine translocation signal domain-containing protein [Halorussus ruber]
MSNDNLSTPTRRSVLKATGAAAAATTVGPQAVSARPDSSDPSLPEGTRVFLGGNVSFDLPAGLERSGLGNADLIVVAPDTTVARGNLVAALKQGKPVAFAGTPAFDGLLSTVFDVPQTAVEQAIRNGRPHEGTDLPYSFGFEYSYANEETVALAFPASGSLNIFRLRTGEATSSTVFDFLGQKLQAGGDDVTTTGDTTLQPTGTICPPATGNDTNWNCLGLDDLSVSDPCPYGGWDRRQWGARLQEDDTGNDWFGWETELQIIPSANEDNNCSSNQWRNDFMSRSMTFNDGEIDDYGPPSDEGDYTTTKSVGFSLSAGFDSVEGTGSISFSESKTTSGVKVGTFVGNADEQVDYDFDIKRGGNVSDETLTSYMGQRTKVANNTTSTDYAYDDTWRWYDNTLFGTNTHTEEDYGTAYWSA